MGDTVYVTIPNGDYNEEKIILRRKNKEDEEKIYYVNPKDELVRLSNIIEFTEDRSNKLVINNQDINLKTNETKKIIKKFKKGNNEIGLTSRDFSQ